MKLRELKLDQRFRFVGHNSEFIYRGNGWYSSFLGYDGGPWNGDDVSEVEVIPESEQTVYINQNGRVVTHRDGVVKVDHTVATFTVTIRSLTQLDPVEIETWLKNRFEVRDIKRTNHKVVVKTQEA